MRSNLVNRKVTVLFSGSDRTLHLIEVMAKVRWAVFGMGHLTGRLTPYIDKNAVERDAKTRLAAVLKAKNRYDHDPDHYDMVGVLVVSDDVLSKGSIVWAEEVETQEAVTL